VVALVATLAAVGAGAFLVLHSAADHLEGGAVRPTPVYSSTGVNQPVSESGAAQALLRFVPDQDANSLGAAMCSATGQPQCSLSHFPGQIRVTAAPHRRFLVTVTMRVRVKRLIASGEVVTGSLPGASSLASGHLAVSTNSAIYGVNMNPRTHTAVFTFWISRRGGTVWATNWNALGAVSQSSSLQ
jgi:hypothetical protein